MREVSAYFIGGPMDLTKKRIDYACESFRWPSLELSFHIDEKPDQITKVKCHNYRRIGRISDEIAIFVYEGTW